MNAIKADEPKRRELRVISPSSILGFAHHHTVARVILHSTPVRHDVT
jgi:hypothetical protein